MRLPLLLAQSQSDLTTSSLEWDWPVGFMDWVPIVLLLLAGVGAILLTIRDTRSLSKPWVFWLAGLRLAFVIIGLIIALNPHERTQTDAYRDSRVIVLIDTSQSMQQPEKDPRSAEGEAIRSRADAVRTVVANSPLIEQLREDHVVDLYTFDADLSELRLRLPSRYLADRNSDGSNPSTANVSEETEAPADVDWAELIEPRGMLTRLGDSLDKLLTEARSPTLSGIIVISDGASNSGRDLTVPRERAVEEDVRLVTVGVGSTQPPLNLEVVRVVAPTDVQLGDAFELSAQLRGQGLAGENVRVELLQKGPDADDASVIETAELSISEDGGPTEVVFDLRPSDAGDFEYTVRALVPNVSETRTDDNQQSRMVSLFDRPLRTLIIAGGPLREYRYARTALYRHPSMETDVWLQSGAVGISQEANRLLFRFPESIESLYGYDVLVAFDPDWSQLSADQMEMLSNWISNEGGGLIVVAGDVYTPRTASEPDLEPIRRLYPVLLEEIGLRISGSDSARVSYPLEFTQEGQSAEFLDLEEPEGVSAWEEFPGIFRTYPTRGVKRGATVYAESSDPLARGRGGQPAVIAAQRYGQGQILYLGTPEFWRLRSVGAEYLERLWVKLIRKASEGRSKRGLQRAMFLLEGREFLLGQTVPIRLRALSPQFMPLVSDIQTIEVIGPNGVPVVPSPQLRRDPQRPGEFVGDLRPLKPGRYRLEFAIPDSSDKATTEIDVQLPRQEAASLIQEREQLERLTVGTNGGYVSLSDAAAQIPAMLPHKGERIVIDQQIRELWNRQWLMFLLAGLLSIEWLTRKLLKLA